LKTFFSGFGEATTTMRPASFHGNGWIRMALIKVKMTLLAPMPRASVTTTMTVNPGFLRSVRML
jgi:hypothetical protein